MGMRRRAGITASLVIAGAAFACRPTSSPPVDAAPAALNPTRSVSPIGNGDLPASSIEPDAGEPDVPDPMSSHADTREQLLGLFSIKPLTEEESKRIQPEPFLRAAFGTDGPGHMNQGNKSIASHLISKEACLESLRGMTLQTPEQKAMCGADNMVPVWIKGKDAWFCIDIFEFPNRACELPMVYTPPTWAKKTCELQGKRLCAQTEWNIACRGDPDGGDDRRYAYGDKVDLAICNTHKGHKLPCSPLDSGTVWKTCATETEPSGAFPKCRSRFGVFDQHGNVAEVMARREGDQVFSQLKGSAWFYDELVREPDKPVPETTPNKASAYPDHCNFDPRWHVEKIDSAWHVNYHLGFRCCKSIP